MWTEQARLASAQARQGAGGGAVQPSNLAQRGAQTQAQFVGASRPAPGGGGGGSKAPAGSVNGVSGRAPAAAAAAPAPAAHGSGVGNVARTMGGNASQMDTRADKTRIDQLKTSSTPAAYQTDRNSNAIDGLESRYSAGSMVGDHTTPPALQKYLD